MYKLVLGVGGSCLAIGGTTVAYIGGMLPNWNQRNQPNPNQLHESHQLQSQSQPQSQSQSQPNSNTQSQQPIILHSSSNEQSSNISMMGYFGIALCVAAAYFYYSSKSSTEDIKNKVEETSGATQDMVVQADKNNEQRFNILDNKNTERANELELSIRSEQKAGFNVIKESLASLTLICSHILTSLAPLDNQTYQNNNNRNGEQVSFNTNEKTLDFVDQVQSNVDTILSEEYYNQSKKIHEQEVKAEIMAKQKLKNDPHRYCYVNGNYVTAGGPDDYNNNNYVTPDGKNEYCMDYMGNNNNNNDFNVMRNQTPCVTNISVFKNGSNHNNNNDNKRDIKYNDNDKNNTNDNKFRYYFKLVKNQAIFVHNVLISNDSTKKLYYGTAGMMGLSAMGYIYFTYSKNRKNDHNNNGHIQLRHQQ